MEIPIFSILTFLGLFLYSYGVTRKDTMWAAAGAILIMLVGTAVAADGISFVTGSITNDLGNGTLIVSDATTTQNDWLTMGVGRAMFWLGLLGMVLSVMTSGEVTEEEKFP